MFLAVQGIQNVPNYHTSIANLRDSDAKSILQQWLKGSKNDSLTLLHYLKEI
jgi:hypothetical protein